MRPGTVAAVLALAGCTALVDDIDLSGRACPCVEGYVCEQTTATCQPTSSGDGAIRVSNLRVVWSTPNQLRWAWDVEGVAEDLREYQLVVGRSAAEVTSRAQGTRVFTARENPELGRFVLPRTGTGDVSRATTSDEHSPSTDYFGQLIAIDTAGGSTVTNVAAQRTADPAIGGAIVVFRDTLPAGAWLLPSQLPCESLDVRGTRPFAGSAHLEYVLSACQSTTYANLQLGGMRIGLQAINTGSFAATAYLEFAIASNARVTSYWSDVYLGFGDGSSTSTTYGHFNPWTTRSDDRYRVIQVPLRSMVVKEGSTLQHAHLEAGLRVFSVGGVWDSPATVRIDEVRILH